MAFNIFFPCLVSRTKSETYLTSCFDIADAMGCDINLKFSSFMINLIRINLKSRVLCLCSMEVTYFLFSCAGKTWY